MILLSLIAAGALGAACAAGPEEDSYREACRVLSSARQALQEKESDLAWQRYLEAKGLFTAIQRDYPRWNAGAIAAHLAVCASGGEKTAPPVIRLLDQSIRELKILSVSLDKLKTQKLVALQQADWEYNFIYDRITRLMGDYVAQRAFTEEEENAPPGPTAEEEALALALAAAGLAETEVAGGMDSDDDGLDDEMEVEAGTNPDDPDTDNDGFYDGDEVELGYDPLDESSHPDVDEVSDYEEDNVNWEEQEGYTEEGEPILG